MEIVIRIVDGKFTVSTAISDKVTALGMLELAKAVILSQPAPSAVQVPTPDMSKRLLVGAGHNGHG